MNFKKYHVSKNLFDEEYPNIDSTVRYRALNLGNGTYTLSSTVEISQGSAGTLFFLAGNVSSGASTATNAVYKDRPITVTSTDGYVTIAYRIYTTDTPVGKETMLNTGTTALPYEPYSSEVWHDIPYYIHNTSTDTITTLPADLYANDTTATVGLKGDMEQSGTPTSQTPIQPSECGERTGNLFDKDNVINGRDLSASTGNLVNGQTKCVSDYIEISENTSYTTHNVTTYVLYNNSKEYLTGLNIETGGIRDVTIDNTNAKYIRIACEMDDKSTVMLNTGSTALPYEPYGIKIPILSNSTTTNVYLGEVQSTRKIKKLVLTGGESGWLKNTSASENNAYYRAISDYYRYNGLCSHYATVDSVRAETGIFFGSNINFLTKLSDEIDTVDKWKSYLAQQYAAGTPVTVWYVLATETTGIVNEPLMKIGDYADTVSNVSIPVTAGGDTISVGTTVQPSEVTVNYKGWHPVADVHERNNGAWT